MGNHNLYDKLSRSHMKTPGRMLLIPSAGYMFGWGTTAGNGVENWAKGAIYLDLDASAGARVLTNAGDKTTASWKQIASLDAANTWAAAQALAAGGTVAADQTFAVATADKLTVGGVIVPQQIEVSCYCPLNADCVDQLFFIAQRAYLVTAINYVHDANEDAGTVNIQVERRQGTEAAGSGDALLTNNTNAGFDGTATDQTVQAGTLVAAATRTLAAGDRLGLDFTGDAPGELAGVCVTCTLVPV